MIRPVFHWVCAAIVIVTAVPVAAAPPDRLTLEYRVYVGGIRTLKAVTRLDLGPDSYAIRVDAGLVGLPAVFAGWWAVATAEGVVEGGRIRPRNHRVARLHRDVVKTIDMRYRADGGIDVAFEPRQDDIVPIEPAAMAEAIDPLSAMVSLIAQVSGDGGCAGTLRAFDGKRRYDLVLTAVGPETLEPSRFSSYAGPALHCRMRRVPVAGDWDWDERDGDKAARERVVDLWLAAPVAGGPMVPVRAEGDIRIGRFYVHLADAEPGVPVTSRNKT